MYSGKSFKSELQFIFNIARAQVNLIYQRLKKQALYHEIPLLKKFNDISGEF